LLDREGFETSLCTSGEATRETALKCMPDLIILDAGLEDPDPFVLCEALSGDPMLTGVPIMMLSLDSQDSFPTRATAAGAAACLALPADGPQIVGAIDNALVGVPSLDSQVYLLLPDAAAGFMAKVASALPGRRLVLALPDPAVIPTLPRGARVTVQRLSAGSGPVSWHGMVSSSHRGRGIEVVLTGALDTPAGRSEAPIDRRAAERRPVDLAGSYHLPSGEARRVAISNLSIAGMRLTGLSEKLEPGQLLPFVIRLGQTKLSLGGEVRWVRELEGQDLCAGVAFRDIDSRARDAIVKYLFRKPANP
jgi:CheY-like chemotaxis protein